MMLVESVIPLDRYNALAGGPVVYLGELSGTYIVVPQAEFAHEFNQVYAGRYPLLPRPNAYSDWQMLSHRGWANYKRVSEEQLIALKAVGELLTAPDYWLFEERVGRALLI